MSKPSLHIISGYPEHIVNQVQTLIVEDKFVPWFQKRYPSMQHEIQSDRALYDYVTSIKNRHLKKTGPLSKIMYDSKIHDINKALGTHTYTTKVHGNHTIRKNEIRIASLFKKAPEPLLRMLAVHELVHIKEKEHNKAFYQLCCHIEPDYHQLEFDARLFMIFDFLSNLSAK